MITAFSPTNVHAHAQQNTAIKSSLFLPCAVLMNHVIAPPEVTIVAKAIVLQLDQKRLDAEYVCNCTEEELHQHCGMALTHRFPSISCPFNLTLTMGKGLSHDAATTYT